MLNRAVQTPHQNAILEPDTGGIVAAEITSVLQDKTDLSSAAKGNASEAEEDSLDRESKHTTAKLTSSSKPCNEATTPSDGRPDVSSDAN